MNMPTKRAIASPPDGAERIIDECIAEAWRTAENNDEPTEADFAADIVRYLTVQYLRHRVHYISADGPEPDATWSVYREEYLIGSPDEPIPGTTRLISTHPTEATANAEASRLQR